MLTLEENAPFSSAYVGLRLTVDLPYTAEVWYVISTSASDCTAGVRCRVVPEGVPFVLNLPLEFLLAPTFRFTVSLGARAYDLGEVNLMNTALLDLALPAGYTFTSSSELFLPNWEPTVDGPPNPAPEPTTLALLGLGLAGLAATRRRKQ